MKKILFILFTGLAFSSCKKDNATIDFEARFTTNQYTYETNENISFDNDSKGAFSYEWDFGDNNSSTEENPVHSYSSYGERKVILNIFNEDKTQSKSFSKNINIESSSSGGGSGGGSGGSNPTTVSITQIKVLSIPTRNWDLTSDADLYVQITDASNFVFWESGYISDAVYPASYTNANYQQSSNASINRFIDLWDYDNLDDDNIGFVGFNLANYTTGTNAYPNFISLNENGISIQLFLNWQ